MLQVDSIAIGIEEAEVDEMPTQLDCTHQDGRIGMQNSVRVADTGFFFLAVALIC